MRLIRSILCFIVGIWLILTSKMEGKNDSEVL